MEPLIFTTILTQFPSSPIWGWHFLVPPSVAQQLIQGKSRRVICTINDTVILHSALMPDKGTWFIMINQQIQKKLKIPLHGEITVSLSIDLSEYGMPMPEEFREVLDQNPDADTFFHTLTAGKQRSLLYIIGKVKNSESRIRKSLAIADHLIANRGSINYKLLHEALKEYNKM